MTSHSEKMPDYPAPSDREFDMFLEGLNEKVQSPEDRERQKLHEEAVRLFDALGGERMYDMDPEEQQYRMWAKADDVMIRHQEDAADKPGLFAYHYLLAGRRAHWERELFGWISEVHHQWLLGADQHESSRQKNLIRLDIEGRDLDEAWRGTLDGFLPFALPPDADDLRYHEDLQEVYEQRDLSVRTEASYSLMEIFDATDEDIDESSDPSRIFTLMEYENLSERLLTYTEEQAERVPKAVARVNFYDEIISLTDKWGLDIESQAALYDLLLAYYEDVAHSNDNS